MRARSVVVIVNSTGSAAVFRKPLIEALKAEGCSVCVVTPPGRELDTLRKMGVRLEISDVSRAGLSVFEYLRYLIKLAGILRALRPDAVHTFTHKCNIAGGIAALFASIDEVYLHITGLGTAFVRPGARYAVITRGIKICYRLLAPRVTRIFVQNARDTFLVRQWTGSDDSKVVHIHGSGVDTNLYRPIETAQRQMLRRTHYDLDDDTAVVILLCARAVREKGIREFYEAARYFFEKHPGRASFVHIGDDEQFDSLGFSEASLAGAARAHGVRYLGHQSNVMPYIQCSDVGCLPSYREGLSRFLAECLACGLPIVTTDAPGCSDAVIEERNGFVAPRGDVAALVHCLEQVLAADRDSLGLASRAIALEFFSSDRVTRRVLGMMKA